MSSGGGAAQAGGEPGSRRVAVVPVADGGAGAVVAERGGRAAVVPVTEGGTDAGVGGGRGRVAVVPVESGGARAVDDEGG